MPRNDHCTSVLFILVQLACKLWFEWLHFDFARYVATKADMIKQQVYLP